MTKAEAKHTFAKLMKAARQHKLSTAARGKLSRARAILQNKPKATGKRSLAGRAQGPSARRRYHVARAHSVNPPGVQIYPNVKSIVAQKGPGHPCDAACKRANHTYIHRFKPGAKMLGMPDGSLRIRR